MKHREQVMTMRPKPIMIATAHGVIEIHRVDGDRRKIRLLLPDGLIAKVGLEQVEARSEWVDVVDGEVSLKHPVLESVTNDSGDEKLVPARPLKVSINRE